MESHDILTKTCGKEPRGFISPAWSTSKKLVSLLKKNGYLYDTSLFPSYIIWGLMLKLWWNFKGHNRQSTVLDRSDRFYNVFSKRTPFFWDGLLVILLPVTPVLRIPCWHWMSFIINGNSFKRILDKCLQEEYFYYLMHPADLLDRKDMPAENKDIKNIERLDVPLASKINIMEEIVRHIIYKAEEIVTLEEIALEIINNENNNIRS